MRRETAPLGAPCWVDLMTKDPQGARSFYGSLLGWQADEPNADFGGYFNFTRDGELVAGGMTNDGMAPMDVWSVYLAVDDAAATVDAATARGAQVIVPSMAVAELGSMAVVTDPTGAAVGMWQPGTHPGFQRLGEPGAPAWFELATRDHDAAVPFYRDVFGWDAHVLSDSPELRYTTLGDGEGASAGIEDASGHLPDGVPSHWIVYFSVEDTDDAVARATELGATVVTPAQDSPHGRFVALADPTGAVFRLIGPAPGSGS